MYRVVIVEDDPMVSLLNRTFVERDARFQVVQSFQDGRAALAWLEQNPADLAVLDVYMPLFTGLELLHALRGQGVGIDAIMVTAANDAPTVDTLLKLGVVDYLVKPFTYERFQQALDTFCRHRDAVAGTRWSRARWTGSFPPPSRRSTSRPRASRRAPWSLCAPACGRHRPRACPAKPSPARPAFQW